MSSFKSNVKGFAELAKALEQIAPELATKAGQTTIRKAGKTVADEYKANVPVSEDGDRSPMSEQYGHLKDNIRVRKSKTKSQHLVAVVVTVGNAFWGRFLEYGTKTIEARHTFKKSFDAVQQKIVDDLATDLGKELDKIAKKYGRK